MVAVPEATPVTTPRLQFTVATDALDEDHNPPDDAIDNWEVRPAQIVVRPVIDAPVAPTDSTMVAVLPDNE